MATTTFRVFVDGLEALTISGVDKMHTSGPPRSVTVLPCAFVQFPRGESSTVHKGRDAHWPTLRSDLVVLVEAIPQKTQGINFDATVTMMDSVKTALDGFSKGKTACRWKMDAAAVTIGKTEFWAVIAEVEVDG